MSRAVLSIVALLAVLLLLCGASPAAAATTDLSVTMDRSLTPVTDSAALTVSGDMLGALGPGDTIEVRITGPAALQQVRESSSSLPVVGSFSVVAGSLPAAARPSGSQLHLPIPMTALPVFPGAFRVKVEIRTEGALVATGSTWMGRLAVRDEPLDVAFVWRAELGIHRDIRGHFLDTVLDQASAAGGALSGLAGLSTRYPDWRFSLGIEPVLLTQLRDMADGFTRADGSEQGAGVGADDPAAEGARSVLAGLVAAVESGVEPAAGPYAGADLGLLGTADWRDGFEQIQIGKQELTQALALGLPPAGAVSPGLELSSGSLGDYGRASIDHVLVDAAVAAALNEKVAKGVPAVRVHDEANDRVTLVLADSDVSSLVAAPWDASALFAGIAAVLSSEDRDALVITQRGDFVLPPSAYLDALGKELDQAPWIRTQTMSDLLKSHPPNTRPLLLTRDPAMPAGYIAETIFAEIQGAHQAVDDLALAADPASLSLEAARRSLYLAESRWWSRPGVSPEEASAGLAYAIQAKAIARDTLAKIELTGVKDALVFGRDGAVTLLAKNGGDSAMTVELRLSGDGLRFPDGDTTKVRLEPGGNNLTVPVAGTSKSRVLTARLAVGRTVLGEQSASLRFVTVVDILPWVGIAVLVIILSVLTMLLVRRRKARRA